MKHGVIVVLYYYYYYHHHYHLSSLCRIFAIVYLKIHRVSGVYCCSYSVVASYGACNVISHDKRMYVYISTSPRTCAVPNMAVCCSSLISCFRRVLFDESVRICVNVSEIYFCEDGGIGNCM